MAAPQVIFIPPNAPCVDCKTPVGLDPTAKVTRELLRAIRCPRCAGVREAFGAALSSGQVTKEWEILVPETEHGRRPRRDRRTGAYFILLKFRRVPGPVKLAGTQWFYRHVGYLGTRDPAVAATMAAEGYLSLAERFQGRCGPIKRLRVKPELLETKEPEDDKDPDRYISIYRAKVPGYSKRYVTRYRVQLPSGQGKKNIGTIEKARVIRDELVEHVRVSPKICFLCKRPPVWRPRGPMKRAILEHLHDDCPNQFVMSSAEIPPDMKGEVWNKQFSRGNRQHFGKRPIGPRDLYWLGVFGVKGALLREEEVFYEAHDGQDIHTPRPAEPADLDDFEV